MVHVGREEREVAPGAEDVVGQGEEEGAEVSRLRGGFSGHSMVL